THGARLAPAGTTASGPDAARHQRWSVMHRPASTALAHNRTGLRPRYGASDPDIRVRPAATQHGPVVPRLTMEVTHANRCLTSANVEPAGNGQRGDRRPGNPARQRPAAPHR